MFYGCFMGENVSIPCLIVFMCIQVSWPMVRGLFPCVTRSGRCVCPDYPPSPDMTLWSSDINHEGCSPASRPATAPPIYQTGSEHGREPSAPPWTHKHQQKLLASWWQPVRTLQLHQNKLWRCFSHRPPTSQLPANSLTARVPTLSRCPRWKPDQT